MTTKLTSVETSTLLSIAREAIASWLAHQQTLKLVLDEYSPSLGELGACFVTLTNQAGLRGCVGSIEAVQPLVYDVRDRAVGAAFQDPRFPPVTGVEIPDLRIEISRLTKPRKISYLSADELLQLLTPGKDGVIIKYDSRRATFLPQVWDQLPDPETFLGRLCLKMGLNESAWMGSNLDVEVYQVEKFGEGSPTAP